MRGSKKDGLRKKIYVVFLNRYIISISEAIQENEKAVYGEQTKNKKIVSEYVDEINHYPMILAVISSIYILLLKL